jgi:hypothetical protein
MGSERRSAVMEDKVKLAVSYHEVCPFDEIFFRSFSETWSERACTGRSIYQRGDAVV